METQESEVNLRVILRLTMRNRDFIAGGLSVLLFYIRPDYIAQRENYMLFLFFREMT
jgi:hypothetical protein